MSDPEEAEDVAQEALLQAWRHRAQLRQPERWREWLGQIARNQAVKSLSRDVPVPAKNPEDSGEPDSRLESLVEAADLRAALASLSQRDQEILRLRYVEDLTQLQVAKRLRISESAAKVRLNRARKRLAIKFGERSKGLFYTKEVL